VSRYGAREIAGAGAVIAIVGVFLDAIQTISYWELDGTIAWTGLAFGGAAVLASSLDTDETLRHSPGLASPVCGKTPAFRVGGHHDASEVDEAFGPADRDGRHRARLVARRWCRVRGDNAGDPDLHTAVRTSDHEHRRPSSADQELLRRPARHRCRGTGQQLRKGSVLGGSGRDACSEWPAFSSSSATSACAAISFSKPSNQIS